MAKKFSVLLCLLFATSMLLSVLTIPQATAGSTTVYVDPPSIVDPGLVPGEMFNVTIKVSNVSDLFAWQIKLSFNGEILNVTRTIYPPDHVFAGQTYIPLGPVIDNVAGSVLVGASLLVGDPFNGDGKFVIIEFLVTGQGQSVLGFVSGETILLDSAQADIPHTTVDGYFENAAPPPPATMYISPERIVDPLLVPCSNFVVNVSIANATDVYMYEFKLGFNSSVLNVVDAELGDFFPSSVTPQIEINNPAGYLWFSAELEPPETPKSGDGVLAIITFHVEDYGVTNLDLYDTVLKDEAGGSLSHTALDGFFNNIQLAKLYISPSEIIDPGLLPSVVFTVDVMLDDVENLYGYEFNLGYNTEMLTCIGIMIHPVLNETHFTTNMMMDDGAGHLWVKVTYYPPASPITTFDPVSIVTLTFMVDNVGSSPLDLYNTSLTDVDGDPIPHEAIDGYVQTLIRDVAITNVVCSHTWAYSGWIVNVTVTAKNLGNVSETFDVTAYYDSSPIGTLTVTDLAPNTETELIFVWNTSDVAEGLYTLSATASYVPYEFNTTNNNYVDGTIEIRELIRDVAIIDVYASPSEVYVGDIVNITVIVKNEGNVSETFDVSVYYNDTVLIETQSVIDLPSGEEIALLFFWNTTGLTPCNNYTIRAEASSVPFEFDLSDNVFINGYIKIKLVGDINGDGKVDVRDLALVSASFGSYPGHPRWNPEVDLNHDGKIDIRDIAIVASHYGEIC